MATNSKPLASNILLCIQGMNVNPTEKEFAGMVRERLLTNCPITVRNVDNANRIFGPDLANLRGEMTRKIPKCVRVKYVQIPWDFVQLHKYVTLVADVRFVNGLPFLVTSLRGLSLVTIEHLPSRTAKRLAQTLERVFRIQAERGFAAGAVLFDLGGNGAFWQKKGVTLRGLWISEKKEILRKLTVFNDGGDSNSSLLAKS